MKKFTLFFASLMLIQIAFAGGLVTNTNQSAQFIRMMSRNASTGIDAVYFNPGGLTKLSDGLHFAVYSQSILQDKNIYSGFALLNNKEYVGEVMVPVFPTAFAVYKKENWAFSLGFGPNGGGGSAEYKTGMPSFEIPISKVVPGLAGLKQINAAYDVKGYNANLYLNGSSIFWGIQLGATYKISDAFSVYGGVRYLPAKNSYDGYIKDINLVVGSQTVNASTWLTQTGTTVNSLAGQAKNGATQLAATATSIQPLIAGGAAAYTLAQVQGANLISSAQKAQLEGGLAQLGLTPAQIGAMNMTQIQGAYNSGATQYNATSNTLTATAAQLNGTATLLGDKKVLAEQTGNAFTPMIGFNLTPVENLNIGVKYEMQTNLKLTNNTTVDNIGLYPDGAEVDNGVPAVLALGAGYQTKKIEAQLSYTMFFDKAINYGKNIRDLAVLGSTNPAVRSREINKNGYEVGLGLQFNLSKNFAVSVGGLKSKSDVADSYQSDFSYTNPSITAGAGLMWKINKSLNLDAGFSNTFYEDVEVDFTDPSLGAYKDTYGKTTMTFAVGLSYSILSR